jgi:hypothetical protein
VVNTAGRLALGVWDFANTGNVSAYTLPIAGLVLYAVTAGRRDLKRIDAGMAPRLTPRGARSASSSRALWRSNRRPQGLTAEPRRGWEKSAMQLTWRSPVPQLCSVG